MLFNLKKIIAYQAIWRTPTILSNAYSDCDAISCEKYLQIFECVIYTLESNVL